MKEFEGYDPAIVVEGFMNGAEGFRITGNHETPDNPHHMGSLESQAFYLGYVKALQILTDLFRRTDHLRDHSTDQCDSESDGDESERDSELPPEPTAQGD